MAQAIQSANRYDRHDRFLDRVGATERRVYSDVALRRTVGTIGAHHVVEARGSGIVHARAALREVDWRDIRLAASAGCCGDRLRGSWLRHVLIERVGPGSTEHEPAVQSPPDWPSPQPVRSYRLAEHARPRYIWRDRRLSRDNRGSTGQRWLPRQRLPAPISIDQNRTPAALDADSQPSQRGTAFLIFTECPISIASV